MQTQSVSKVIEVDEPCVRCVMHPLMYSVSDQKLKREAILPAPNRNDVSLLRLNYTTLEFCITHGKKLSKDSFLFKCLATLLLQDVMELNKESDKENSLCPGIKANVVYAPMHQGKYILDKDVFINDPDVDLPMHADLTYNQYLIRGEVSTKMRKYASMLIKKMSVIYKEPF